MELLTDTTRRNFLGMGLLALSCGVCTPVLAKTTKTTPKVRALSFRNLHTDEKLRVVYWKDGAYDHKAWEKINHILRDHYSGETHTMNLKLLDLLHDLQTRMRTDKTIEIISGYRSTATNDHLSEIRSGIAKKSYHMRGMAVDIRLDGAPLSKLHAAALSMKRGGVGYYPKSKFVHLDVGPIRRWG